MLLAVDAGNTNTKFAVYDGDEQYMLDSTNSLARALGTLCRRSPGLSAILLLKEH